MLPCLSAAYYFQLITLMRVFSFFSYFEFTRWFYYNFTRGLLLLFFIIIYMSSQLSLVPLPNTDTQLSDISINMGKSQKAAAVDKSFYM